MTVSSTTTKTSYAGNGSTLAFSCPFYFIANADLKVTVRSATGTEIVKTLTTHYTVTGAGVSAGGTVTMVTAPAAGETLVLQRNVALTQEVDYQANDPFPANTHEQALDKLTMEAQQINEAVGRSLKISTTNTMTSTEFTVDAAARANKVLGFDSAGELSVAQELGNYRSAWASGTSYVQRDIVKDGSNSNIYICVTAHTASGTTPISSNADVAKWGLLVDAATASASSTSAAASAATATTQAGIATTQAATATTQASNASTSATSAASSATGASGSASSALASYNDFRGQYYGNLSANPTLDPLGNAIGTGDLYFNTTTNVMMVYSGSAWVAAYASSSGALLGANNLADVASAATARTNLGLGALATAASATVAQGGTGQTTLAANAVLIGNGTGAVAAVAPSTVGNVMTSNGTAWTSAAPSATVAQGGTGAATLAANAVLIGNGTSAVTAVAPSTAGNVLTSTGSAWASTAPTSTGINLQTFTSSGTWTKPSLAAGSRVLIQAWAGGGSGSKTTAGGGIGGGGGGYNERWLSLSAMGATETITIGAGGTAVTTNASGNNGGNSSAGSLITGYAGAGGAAGGGVGGGGQLGAASGTTAGSPAIMASTTTNICSGFVVQVNNIFVGQAGYPGVLHGGGTATASVWGGAGGGFAGSGGATSSFGGNGGAGNLTTSGVAGSQPGGGGGGTNTGTSSGAGGAGQIIITVFPA